MFFTLGILDFILGILEFLCDFSRNSRFYSRNSRIPRINHALLALIRSIKLCTCQLAEPTKTPAQCGSCVILAILLAFTLPP